jgi:hypothetical protein
MAGPLALGTIIASWNPDPVAGQQDSQKRRTQSHGTLPQPIVDTHQLMELFNKPLYQHLKQAMQQQPADDEGWDTIEERGLQAAEVMNLVAIRERDEAEQSKWQRHVQTAQQAGLKLTEAAKSRDWEQTQAAYQGLIRNCNTCHQQIAPDHAPQIQP